MTKLRFLALIILSACCLATAHAAPPFYWESIAVDIEVQEHGDMLVTETQEYVFTAKHTNERYRWIRLDRVDRITDVEVFENGQALPHSLSTKNGQLWIKWQHALHPPETHSFVIKYRVIGGLQLGSERDRVYWKAIFAKRAVPVRNARVTVHLPASLTDRILGFKSFGAAALAHQVDPRTIEFTAYGAVPPGHELEVLVEFPHGLLAAPQPRWQATRGAETPVDQSSSSSAEVILMTLAFGVFALPILGHSSNRCPNCNKAALVASGVERPTGSSGKEYQLVCDACGYDCWRRDGDDDGYGGFSFGFSFGGGDGGDGGGGCGGGDGGGG